jgi:endonuclease G, mitochondrial
MRYFSLLIIFINTLIYSQDLKPLGLYNDVVSHSYYTLSYSEDHEQAEWVYYTLNSNQLNSSIERKNNFRADNKVKTSSAQLYDYEGSGYDRGHLAPAADMKYNTNSMSESFFMSNMSPQSASFNREIWRKIEKQFRDWSYKYGELVIITGPVLKGENYGSIGYNKVTIPKWYYKVAIDPSNYDRNVAILIENIGSSATIKSFVVTIDYLEEFSGLDFFHSLPDEVEESFESSTHTDLWDWNMTYVSKPRTTNSYKAPTSNGEIFRTTTGKKYHNGNCRYLSKSKIPITIAEAKEKDLGPCGVCKP